MKLYLDFHGHSMVITGSNEEALQKLSREFYHYVVMDTDFAKSVVELIDSDPPLIPSMVASETTEGHSTYKISSKRYVIFKDHSLVLWDVQEETIKIYAQNGEALYTRAYQVIHSILERELGKQGICRMNALGITHGKVNALVFYPNEVEKKHLLDQLLDNKDLQLISDQMPLLDYHGMVHSFPTEKFKDRYRVDVLQNDVILVSAFKLSRGKSLITQVPKWKMIAPLLTHVIHPKRIPPPLIGGFNLSWFVRIACVVQLLRRAKCYHLYLGEEAQMSATLLKNEIKMNQDIYGN